MDVESDRSGSRSLFNIWGIWIKNEAVSHRSELQFRRCGIMWLREWFYCLCWHRQLTVKVCDSTIFMEWNWQLTRCSGVIMSLRHTVDEQQNRLMFYYSRDTEYKTRYNVSANLLLLLIKGPWSLIEVLLLSDCKKRKNDRRTFVQNVDFKNCVDIKKKL